MSRDTKPTDLPAAEYTCWACKCYWIGYRILWSDEHQRAFKYLGYGPTECPRNPQEHIYVTWINWEECRVALGRYWEE